MTRPQIYLSLLLLLFTPSSAPAQPQADPPQPSTQAPAGAPVIFIDEPVFLIYGRVGSFTPQERAKAISERLELCASSPTPDVEECQRTRLFDLKHMRIVKDSRCKELVSLRVRLLVTRVECFVPAF